MGAAVAVILLRERQIAEAFERAGATAASRGRSPAELDVDAGGTGWRRLRDRAVVRESSPGSGLYYLDTEVWEAVRRTRHRAALVLLVVMLVGLALVVMGGTLGAHFGVSNR
jgi:hypothetical protein